MKTGGLDTCVLAKRGTLQGARQRFPSERTECNGESKSKRNVVYDSKLNLHLRKCFSTTKAPVRLSRNRNSEYLPQRRKGRKVRRLRVKIIYKSFCPFPITLAPLRLGGRNSRLRVLSMPDYLRRPRKFLTIVIRRARSSKLSLSETFVSFAPSW